jgi:hypothetical protein
MNKVTCAWALAAALVVSACAEDQEPDPYAPVFHQPLAPLELSVECRQCIAEIGGGVCADELDACEADAGCWQFFYALSWCNMGDVMWTPEEADACISGASLATPRESKQLGEALYCCTWGLGNPPIEWLNCLHGGVEGSPYGCDEYDNAMMNYFTEMLAC